MKRILFLIAFLLFSINTFAQANANTILSLTSPSSASTTTPANGVITGVGTFTNMSVVATLTGATGGTLDVYIQASHDCVTYFDYAHYAQITAAASAVTKFWAVTKETQQTTPTTVGTGTAVALTANTVVGGDYGNCLRVVFVAGSGTSAGAAQTLSFYFTR